MVEILTTCAFFALVAVREWFFAKERAEWRAERQTLLDRIQAPSFVEYKAQERTDKPKEKKEKPKEPDFL